MQARIRRLRSDFEQVTALFAEHPFVRIVSSEGEPPEKYTFEIRVRGLVAQEDDVAPRPGLIHRAEVFLPLDYPRRPPFCRMITPVFHPNIDPQKICIGDHWSAGQSLALMVTRIAEMICFQSYNLKSPLNARAAEWAEHNIARLPLQRGDLTAGL
jgi:ubiquitin-protein ligase